jgi:polyvinyl alcohol dehydrogenase (cytochrome)
LKLFISAIALASSLAFGMPGHPTSPHSDIGRYDWPTYGHDPQHTFNGRTTLTSDSARSLAPAWRFPTRLAVTATPTVVARTVYVGSWDGNFYALDLATGVPRWTFQLDRQPAITPEPDGPPDPETDGGLVVSSAWFEPGDATRPDLVIFGGGYTLYALNAHTGQPFWKHAYTGRPDLAPDPVDDQARIFSSPVVVDGKVVFGVSVDGQRGYRGGIYAADLRTGNPVWTRNTDVDADGRVLNDGCGNVWSSGTILPKLDLVVFGVADCHFSDNGQVTEGVLALRPADGTIVWAFHPARHDAHCDLDFGASANAGVTPGGVAKFLGVGGKDGTYYSLDPATGRTRWSTNVVFGGSDGGFIGTTAYDGTRVYGSTALGELFDKCDPANPLDNGDEEPSAHTFDAHTGAIVYQDSERASFAPTTVAGHLTFNCPALQNELDVRDTDNGTIVAAVALPVPCWSGVATVGDALVLGLGATFSGDGSGVIALTPGGAPPDVPDHP